jgi:hypothetical protein
MLKYSIKFACYVLYRMTEVEYVLWYIDPFVGNRPRNKLQVYSYSCRYKVRALQTAAVVRQTHIIIKR